MKRAADNPLNQAPLDYNQIQAKTEPLPLSLDLPNEIWEDIFLKSNFKDLGNCYLVDKKWNQLTNETVLVNKMIYEGFCFNPSHWNEFCGEGTVSDDEIAKAYASLPKDIIEILNSDYNGERVIDTHMLVWMPESIKGEPLTINNFGKLLKEQPEFSRRPTGYGYINNSIVLQEGTAPIKSGWVLMTTDIIPDSQKKRYVEQLILLENLNKNGQTDYRVPKIAEVIICIAAKYLRSKTRLFSEDPLTYTRCQERVRGFQAVVGSFIESGFRVDLHFSNEDHFGLAALRELCN